MILQQGLRFVVVGGFNTAVSYGLYCLLVFWWHPQVAWASVFLLGLVIGYYTHSRFSFAATMGSRKALAYVLVQCGLYLLSSALIHIGIQQLSLGARLAGGLAIAVNVPISFFVSRRVLSDPRADSRG